MKMSRIMAFLMAVLMVLPSATAVVYAADGSVDEDDYEIILEDECLCGVGDCRQPCVSVAPEPETKPVTTVKSESKPTTTKKAYGYNSKSNREKAGGHYCQHNRAEADCYIRSRSDKTCCCYNSSRDFNSSHYIRPRKRAVLNRGWLFGFGRYVLRPLRYIRGYGF